MIAKLRKFVLDAGVLAGLGIFVYGLYLVWHPLAPLLGGLMIAAAFFFAGYDNHRREAFDRARRGGR